jgi:diguanylate cyclase (GGDEF)-like protein/PAS domain S-box-containing protein
MGAGPSDGRSVREALTGARVSDFIVEFTAGLDEGLERLRGSGIAAVLLDGCPADGQWTGAVERIWVVAPHVPVLVIGLPGDEDRATRADTRGVQDYLSRDRLDTATLSRALTRIIERQAVDEALFFEQQRAEVTLRSIGDAVLSTDLPGRVTYLNPVAERMTGWSRQEASGRPLGEVFRIIDARTRQPAPDPMTHAIQLDRTVGLTPNCLLVRRDGFEIAIEDSASPIHDRRGRAIGAVIVFKDVAEARATSQQNIHLAQHDALTDLPNRLLLNDRLTQAIAMARRHGHRLAVMFLDLDRFKHVNDSLGHLIGDMLLRSVARRLVGCVRSSDTVSRQGGDEFIVLLAEIANPENVAVSAKKILQSLSLPHLVDGHELDIGASIGISVYPQDGEDAETLITKADIAMYHAKEIGRDNVQFYHAGMREIGQ